MGGSGPLPQQLAPARGVLSGGAPPHRPPSPVSRLTGSRFRRDRVSPYGLGDAVAERILHANTFDSTALSTRDTLRLIELTEHGLHTRRLQVLDGLPRVVALPLRARPLDAKAVSSERIRWRQPPWCRVRAALASRARALRIQRSSRFDRAETADQRVNVAVQSRDMCRDYRCKIYSKTVKLSI